MPHPRTASASASRATPDAAGRWSGIAAAGISGRYERWKEVAFQYAWLLAAADRDRYGSGQEDNLLSGAQG